MTRLHDRKCSVITTAGDFFVLGVSRGRSKNKPTPSDSDDLTGRRGLSINTMSITRAAYLRKAAPVRSSLSSTARGEHTKTGGGIDGPCGSASVLGRLLQGMARALGVGHSESTEQPAYHGGGLALSDLCARRASSQLAKIFECGGAGRSDGFTAATADGKQRRRAVEQTGQKLPHRDWSGTHTILHGGPAARHARCPWFLGCWTFALAPRDQTPRWMIRAPARTPSQGGRQEGSRPCLGGACCFKTCGNEERPEWCTVTGPFRPRQGAQAGRQAGTGRQKGATISPAHPCAPGEPRCRELLDVCAHRLRAIWQQQHFATLEKRTTD
ncbi:hypothetical protein NA57DRAFT_51968 [Rhizodiscina lignyota]|uniref:Uncharacterized protein n=1 Tax=Rhizodiscina lignyota TaxID=1504668 RepID=A0A9P4M959_9PEZI|nr:hypothetical protein NA57DRAFT_51968 [Rhizodiscina lignyota]